MHRVGQTDDNTEGNSVIISQLANVLRSNGEKVLNGDAKLALTSSVLGRLNECFQQVEVNFGVNLDAHFLFDFVGKTPSLKLSRGSSTLQGNVILSVFKSLKTLEIKRVPLHLVTGLQSLRPHLVAIDCHRCLGSLQELFANCGGDRSSEFAWPELVSAKLSFNDIKLLDISLKLLPNLVSLNLSHNLLSNTSGLQYLPNLKHLNLSYNLLKEVPSLSEWAHSRLNFLNLSNNNIESLKGVESYKYLQHLNVSYNCVLDHCCLSAICALEYLQNLSVLGNPLCYKSSHRKNVVDCLHDRCCFGQFCLDGQMLTKQEIVSRLSSQCLNKHSTNENSCPNVSQHISSPSTFDDFVDFASSSINLSEAEMMEAVSKEIRNEEPKLEKRRRKVTALRDIVINDPVLHEDQGCELASVTSSLSRTFDRELDQTKQEIEQRHRRYGESWLVIENKLSAFNREQSDAIQNAQEFCASEVTNSKEEGKYKRISQCSDDIIVLESDDDFVCKMKHDDKLQDKECCENLTATVSKEVPVDEMSESDKEDDELADLNPFIVQREKPNTDVLETIMVIITDTDIREKHVLTAKTFQRLDLCSIQAITKFEVNSDNGQERRCYAVRVTFNYIKQDKRERVYRLDDMESYQSFVSSLEDAMHATTLKNMTIGALQCLKCSSQFSKHVAKQVVIHPSATIFVSSSVGSSQGHLNEPPSSIIVCPNCDSQLVVELESTSFPNTLSPISRTAQLAGKSTSPKSTLCADKLHVLSPVSDDFKALGPNCCTEVVIKAEVHMSDHEAAVPRTVADPIYDMPSTSTGASNGEDFGYSLRRNGSDITILSNPSQSSIIVVQPGKSESTVDNSFENHQDFDTRQEQLVFNIYDGDTMFNQQQVQSHSKVGSSSSGSMTGSVCTAMEQNLSETLKSPPGTPLISKRDSNFPAASIGGSDKLDENKPKSGSSSASLQYSFADFLVIDHRIRLYLDMHILSPQEECLAVLKSVVVPYGEKEWIGLIVFTNASVHLLKIIAKEGLLVETWLKFVGSHPLQNLRYITSCLGSQGFRLEFMRKNTEGKCYTILLRDADQTNAFISFVADKFQEPEFDHIQVEFSMISDETMDAIAQQLLGDTNSEACEELLLYMMCHWKGSDGELEPVSLVVTESHIYVAKENLLFPKPHIVSASREILAGQQFTLLSKQSIHDLSNLEQYADQDTDIHLKFVNENKQQEVCWVVRAERASSVVSLIEALKTPWERLFHVELHVNIL